MGKISNYASALKAKLTDFFVIASDDNGVLETKKVTTEQIGDAVASDQVHSSLDTSDKTLIGGINEVNSNIGTLSSLTTSDTSSLVGAVNEVAKQILYADVSIGNVSIGANGYADISNNANIPAIPTGYKVLFAVMTNFGSISSKNGGVTIFCPHQNEYWVGSVANDSITGLEIRIVYIKN